MLYFTLKLSEEDYSYEVEKISDNIKDFDITDIIFYTSENLSKGDIIDFWELSTFDVYSGNVYKILNSCNSIANIIDYNDIYDVNDYLFANNIIIVRIEQLIYDEKELLNIFERTSEILCDIYGIDITTY